MSAAASVRPEPAVMVPLTVRVPVPVLTMVTAAAAPWLMPVTSRFVAAFVTEMIPVPVFVALIEDTAQAAESSVVPPTETRTKGAAWMIAPALSSIVPAELTVACPVVWIPAMVVAFPSPRKRMPSVVVVPKSSIDLITIEPKLPV